MSELKTAKLVEGADGVQPHQFDVAPNPDQVGTEGNKNLGNKGLEELKATKDLLNLSHAVGNSVSPEMTKNEIQPEAVAGLTEAEVTEIIHSGEPVKNPADLLTRLMNSVENK